MQIILLGGASQKRYTLDVLPSQLQLSLMDFLREKGFMIASSCSGEGICKKCVVQDGLLSCQVTIQSFLKDRPIGIVEVNYL